MDSRTMFTIFSLFLLCTLFHTTFGNESVLKKQLNKREKRGVSSVIDTIISGVLEAGLSLIGKTVSDLQDGSSVSVAGSVENPTKWRLLFDNCEAVEGKINYPMTSVSPGKKEGFASHKSKGISHAFDYKGTVTKCTFEVEVNERNDDTKTYFHFAYSVPRSSIFSSKQSNKLAFAICISRENNCNDLDGDAMMSKSYTLLKRRVYDDTVSTLFFCRYGICVAGTMGTSEQTIIKIKVYPEKFEDLYPLVRTKLEDENVGSSQYQQFISEVGEVSDKNVNSAAVALTTSWLCGIITMMLAGILFAQI